MAASELLLLWLSAMLMTPTAAVTEDQLAVHFCNMTLNAIPTSYPGNITQLFLSNNLIAMSPSDEQALRRYPKLQELHLNGNLITTLPDKIFASLPELKVLGLSDNNVSEVQPEAFSGLGSLRELDLSRNLLRSLPPEVFGGLLSLTSLGLKRNRLQALPATLDMKRLQRVDLEENPWHCSCSLVSQLKQMNDSGVRITGWRALCESPEDQAGKNILDSDAKCPSGSSAVAVPTTTPVPVQTTTALVTLAQTKHTGIFGRDVDPGVSAHVVGNTWKFLVGVVIIALCTSMLIVCAVKSPSWYKLLFNYRHQRLREEEEPRVFATGGRYSNFSLDTEQTETSAYDLDARLDEEEEEEDGYIEDRYIDTGDYTEPAAGEP